MAIHATAIVDSQVEVHPTATIGAYAVIEGPVQIGAGTVVDPFAVVRGHTRIGSQVQIHSHAVVGDVPQDRRYKGEPSQCLIGNGVVIREGATVHRATGEGQCTVVEDNCYLMTNTHVGHNCVVGEGVMLVSGALLGGHVTVGAGAVISGNTGVHQFVRIGTLAMVACVAPVTQDVPPFMMTDHAGRIVGINVIGLRRAGYSPAQRAQIKEAYRLLYRSPLTRVQVIDALQAEEASPGINLLIEFLQAVPERGIVRGRAQRGGVESEAA